MQNVVCNNNIYARTVCRVRLECCNNIHMTLCMYLGTRAIAQPSTSCSLNMRRPCQPRVYADRRRNAHEEPPPRMCYVYHTYSSMHTRLSPYGPLFTTTYHDRLQQYSSRGAAVQHVGMLLPVLPVARAKSIRGCCVLYYMYI